MMKNRTIKNILLLVIMISAAACKKELNPIEAGTIATDQSFQSLADAKSWDGGFYSSLRGNVYGSFDLEQDYQADQTNASLDFGNNFGGIHRWGNDFQVDDVAGIWQGYYTALANINLCIANFSKIPATSPADKATLNQYLGDAYLARAYYYSELIIRYAKPYSPSAAATDLGVPLVLTFDINAKPARATVKAVYDQILSDITQAETLLAGVAGTPSVAATTFNIDVATALEARVRLYMQDWAGAMAASNKLVTANKYPLITTQDALTAMWTNDVSTEVIFQIYLNQPNELGNANGLYYLGYNAGSGTYDPYFIPTQTVLDSYSDDDYRVAAYFASKPCEISAVSYTLTLVNKFPGNPALWTGATTNYENAPKVFRMAEQYLIYAEAAANSGSNDAQALTVLNTLRTARNETALSGLTGTALLDSVKAERTRELAFEGFRLWDLKRWHQGFTRGTPQNLNAILQGPKYNLLSIPADDYQFVWGIPTNDLQTDKNLVQNPGW